jgi:solute:Na+ symporter, SSS family
MSGLDILDWVVIGLYFLALVVVIWTTRSRQESSKDYFLAGRNIGWFVIGASLFASNIGSEHLVGLAGSGAKSGMAMAHYELHAWCLLVLGWVLAPFYYHTGVFTMPEFLERRYGPSARWILSLVSLVAYVFTKVSVTVYAGGKVFQILLPDLEIAGLDGFWLGALSTVILTGIYTVLGGLRAVVFTDALQAVVLIIGSLFITVIGLVKVGGWQEMREVVGSQHLNMWRPLSDPDFPWAGILFGAPIVGLWYWCTDQYIVQRVLAAKDMKTSRRGAIWGAWLKLTPVFLFIVPGMIAYALAQKGLIQLDEPDQAFPLLVRELLPVGLRGLVVGGLLAALMSSLSSLFNSCSTLFTVDIYEKIVPDASERHLVTVGRMATGIVVVLGIIWIPVMTYVSGALYEYLQSVQAYLAPPITAVFFLGVFSKRINLAGAVSGMAAGFILGMAKMAFQILGGIESTAAAVPGFLIAFGAINFLYFCILLFVFSIVIMVAVSMMTAPPPKEKTDNLTWGTLSGDIRAEIRQSWNKWDILNTLAILLIIFGVYIYFTG